MLYTEAVDKSTLELLKTICAISELNQFALIGGTNLALRLGHRKSVDLDFFTPNTFKESQLEQIIFQYFQNAQLSHSDRQTRQYFIHNIKVEFIGFRYPLIHNFETEEEIRLFSLQDTIAAKLNAVLGRGSKKDFFDIYELLKNYSLKELFNNFKLKFNQQDVFPLLKSLNYFEDAEQEPDPISLNNTSWKQVKDKIDNVLRDYYKDVL
jgi:predicted nucleotidyltransferase component of viral defense system